MSTAIVMRDEQPDTGLVLSPVMNLEVAKRRLVEFQTFVKGYLIEGEDFGTIPGTPKPTLLKPGADKLCELYGLADDYEILTQVEQFNADPPLFDYTIRCRLTARRDGRLVATGVGSCNSYEGKYKWRDSQRSCPKCHKPTIIKGKEEFGGGFLCFAKKGGCGAKFADTDKAIISQAIGRVLNDDLATQKNTILKMAKKRAKIDATLGATRSSGIFTQDIEDMAVAPPEPVSPTQRNAGEANAPKAAPTANGKAKTSPAPSQPKNNLAPAHAPKSDWPVGHGFVQSVTFGTTRAGATSKGGNAYAKVLQEGNTLFCYDDHQLTLADGEIVSVFKLLENAEDSMCHFTVESKGERHKIVGATQIAEHSWLEDGTPCIQREAASPRADGQEEMAY